MSNTSKKKGTAYETSVLRYLRKGGIDVRRQVLHGSRDEGDLIIDGSLKTIIECKDVKSVPYGLLESYKEQTQIEQGNADADVSALIRHMPGNGESKRGQDAVLLTLRSASIILGHPFPVTFTVPNPDDEWVRITLEQLRRWLGGE